MDTLKKIIGTPYRICSLILLLVSAVSCQDDRKDTQWQNQSFLMDEELARNSKDSVDFILKKTMQYNTRFETFSSPLDIRIDAQEQGVSLGGQLRIADNRAIWGNITKFFFEPLRYKLTPDSLIIWNKLDNSATIYMDQEGEEPFLPLIFRFGQSLFLRQIDTLMFQGERALVQSPDEAWRIEGIIQDSLAWSCTIGKQDFRIKAMSVSFADKGSLVQAGIDYMDDAGFIIRVSADEKEWIKADIRYTKAKWDTPLSFPMKFNSSTKIETNRGFLVQGRKLSSGISTPNFK